MGRLHVSSLSRAAASVALASGISALAAAAAPQAGRVAGPSLAAAAERLEEIPADGWINAPRDGFTGDELRGSVVLVEFWTYLCYNCKNVEPWMKQTHVELAPRGVKIIGVHTPEFAVERKTSNVVKYVRENDIVWPVAIDTGWKVWRRYNTTNAWPAFFVYDRNGELVYSRAGERAVTGARTAIETALAEPAGG